MGCGAASSFAPEPRKADTSRVMKRSPAICEKSTSNILT